MHTFSICCKHDAVHNFEDRQQRRLPLVAAVWPALIIIALVVAGCGGDKADGDEIGPPDTTPSSVYFPQRTSDRDDNDALITGQLVVEDKCLYVESSIPSPIPSEDHKRYLIIWPYNAELRFSNGAIEIHDDASQAVARVGDLVRVGGGGVREGVTPDAAPDACHGPYWIAAPGITPVDPVEATQEARSATSFGIYLHRQEPEDRSGIDPGMLTGQLAVVDDCLRVNADDGNSYLIVWPPDYWLDADPMLQVLDAGGREVARVGVGNEARLAGGEKETLGRSLAGDCPGPYWIVDEEAGTSEATETPGVTGCQGRNCR